MIEIGIVLAVIAVLGTAVIASRGYIMAARRKTAIDLVLAIRNASRQWALRHQGGLRYATPGSPADARSVSLPGLRAQGFLPSTELPRTPWGSTKISVRGEQLPSELCADFACIRVEIGEVPVEECEDLTAFFRDRALSVNCDGTLTVVMR